MTRQPCVQLLNPDIPISVLPTSFETSSTLAISDHVVVLMGPIGSGKSSFLEALTSKSGGEPLGIAKNQLDSVTKDIAVYRVHNTKVRPHHGRIFIVDTPGFLDPRISELSILAKVKVWRNRCNTTGTVRVLYFHPITDFRMPGSRKKCLSILQGFWGAVHSTRTILVTSMWNNIPERSMSLAEDRFMQISGIHWADWLDNGSKILKFDNSFESALVILDSIIAPTADARGYDVVWHADVEPGSSSPVYRSLLDRITSIEQQLEAIDAELQLQETQDDAELVEIYREETDSLKLLLKQYRFEREEFARDYCTVPHRLSPDSTIRNDRSMGALSQPESRSISPTISSSACSIYDSPHITWEPARLDPPTLTLDLSQFSNQKPTPLRSPTFARLRQRLESPKDWIKKHFSYRSDASTRISPTR